VPSAGPVAPVAKPSRIEHVIVLMLENRSFDHLFGFVNPPEGQTLDNLLPLNPLPSNMLDPGKLPSASNPSFQVSHPAPFTVHDKDGPSHSFNAVSTQLVETNWAPRHCRRRATTVSFSITPTASARTSST